MSLETTFEEIELGDLPALKHRKKEAGYRCVQMLCTNTDEGIDLTYTFAKDDAMENFLIKGVKKGTKVPSITDEFIGVFPFENEAHDLFGVEVEGIAIDFAGKFYDVAMDEPMTVISPEKKAAKEKAAKIAAAKAAKEKAARSGAAPLPDSDAKARQTAELDEKLAGMDPEKAAKVKAAMEAKAKREEAARGKEEEQHG